MVKIAVILAGCGVKDGSEIHEAVMTLLAIDKKGAEYEIFAPDIKQYNVINHLTGEEMKESRNVLVESARIARGKISALNTFDVKKFNGVIFPGGFGVAKNLCNYALEGSRMSVLPEVAKVVKETHEAGKPIAALCISPVIIARLIENSVVTVGLNGSDATNIIRMGAEHKETYCQEVVVDIKNKIVTAPCYMISASVKDIATGAEKAVEALLELINQQRL